MHAYAIDKISKSRKIKDGFIEECDLYLPEAGSIDSEDKAFQVLGSSSKINADESRENSALIEWWGWENVIGGSGEME